MLLRRGRRALEEDLEGVYRGMIRGLCVLLGVWRSLCRRHQRRLRIRGGMRGHLAPRLRDIELTGKLQSERACDEYLQRSEAARAEFSVWGT